MCFYNEGRFFKAEPVESKQEPERMWEEAKGNPLHRNQFSAAMALASPRSLSQWMHIEDEKKPAVQKTSNTPR